MQRLCLLAVLASFALPACGDTQNAVLNLPAFAHLRSQATHNTDVEIDLDGLPLRLAGWLTDDHDSDTAAARSALGAVHALHVRHYEFATDFAYSRADVDAVREQLSGPGWSRIAHVRKQKESEDVDIYLALDHDRIEGLAIVACSPRELTIVNAVGSLDLAQVDALRRHFDVPHDAAHDADGEARALFPPF